MGTSGDNAIYIILAKSISQYHNYLSLYIADEPYHIHFPPGFPMLLVPFYKIFGSNETYLKILPFLSSIFSFFLMCLIFRNFYILLVLSTFPILINVSSQLLSEPEYLLFSISALYFFKKEKWVLSIILASYSFLIRNLGISLVFSILFVLLYKKKWKAFFVSFLISSIVVLSWFLWIWLHRNPYETNYIQEFLFKNPYSPELGYITLSDFISRVNYNFSFYFSYVIPQNFLYSENENTLFITGLVILLFSIFGFLKEKNIDLIKIYTIFNLVVVFIWPQVWSSDRFLIPILPFIVYYFLEGTRLLGEMAFKLICIFIFLLNLSFIVPKIPQNIEEWGVYFKDPYELYSKDWQNFFQVCNYIKQNIDRTKTIVSRKPQFVYLISGNKGNIYKFSSNPDTVFQSIKGYDYVLVDNFFWTSTTKRYLLPAILKYKEHFKLVYKTDEPETGLFEIIK